MARALTSFKDVLEPRRQENSNFMWISRDFTTTVAYKQSLKPTPKWHKQEVLQSAKIQDIMRRISEEKSKPKEQVEQQVRLILDEIGFNKRIRIIRWLGLVLTKICVRVCTGIHVNEESITRLKQIMGHTPVIFLPSHRSYADFILMSYICFTYDIEIPAIAAGMDFHSMWGMGTMLRDTGAFFMRRSFNDDSLYWDTFRQYISQLITKGDLPLEFFIEGTRSRSGKSLTPKFGLLSMVLKSFFTGEVSDILFVPINISYDRVLEEKLFAYELLGVPKPKESTSAFFKSLSIIKERYGNIYVDFAKPISARDFFGSHIDRSVHNMKPLHLQEFTQPEKDFTSELALEIVHTQQKLSVISAFNLIALSLMNNFMSGKRLLQFHNLIEDVLWLKKILEVLGAITDIKDAAKDVGAAFYIHRGLVQVNNDMTVDLVKNVVDLSNLDVTKLKGYSLSQETMTFVVPFVMLQIYVNPVLHYLTNPAILIVILRHHGEVNKDVLFGLYGFLRSLFSYEFITVEKRDYLDFENSLQHLCDLNLVTFTADKYSLSTNKRLEEVFYNVLKPFVFSYYIVCRILMQNVTNPCSEKSIINSAQAQLEVIINSSEHFVHPYCLSLDTLSNCLGKLNAISVVERSKVNGGVFCQANYEALCSVIEKLEMYVELKPTDEDLRSAQISVHVESKL